MHSKRSVRAVVGALCLPGLAVAGLLVGSDGGAGAATAAPTDRTPLATSGGRIVDRNGAEFVVQGVNWFGFETGNHVVHGLWTRDYREMLAQIRSLGFNTIRLPFSHPGRPVLDDSAASTSPMARTPPWPARRRCEAMDVIVQEAADQGLLVLLDNHSLSRRQLQLRPLVRHGGYTEDDWVANWEMLAQRYRNQANVIGADLKNEPHGRATWGDGAATDWRRAAERAGNAVLANRAELADRRGGGRGTGSGTAAAVALVGRQPRGGGRYPVRLGDAQPARVLAPRVRPRRLQPALVQRARIGQTVLYDRWAKGFQYIADQGIAPDPRGRVRRQADRYGHRRGRLAAPVHGLPRPARG